MGLKRPHFTLGFCLISCDGIGCHTHSALAKKKAWLTDVYPVFIMEVK
tara:strand:- start:281 stop:424 length:144 start_codon:yes stop_codon:yes gene_type:complete